MVAPLRVLYIDDETGLLNIGKLFLEREGGFVIDTLTSAVVALEQLKTGRYDAIVSDYQMPGMDGITFLKQLKASGNTIPFIIFTGKGREEVVIEALNNGADFYLQKGGEPKAQFTELANKIRYAVSRRCAEVDLRESEERYRNVVEDQTEFICRFLPDGTHVFVNEAYCRYFGLNREEIIGTRFHPTIHPEDRKNVARLIATLTPEHPHVTIVQRVIMPDGSIRWQRWVDRAIFHEDGRLKEYQSVGRDITEQKCVEEALKESENKLNAVIRGSPIPQFVIDKNHRVIHWNLALEEYSGISMNEVAGTTQQWRAFYPAARPCLADLLLDNEIEKFPQWYCGNLTKSRFIKGAYEATDFFPKIKGGTWLYFTAAPLRDLNGTVIGAVETLEDITERKKAEQDFQKAYHEYQSLLDQIQDVYYRSDPDGDLVIASRSWATLLGYDSIDECLGKSIAQAFYANPEERKQFLEAIQHAGYVTEYEVTLRKKDGSHILVSTSSHYYYDENRHILGIEGTFRDITAQKTAEKDSVRKSGELEASYKQLAATGEELHKTIEDLSRSEQKLRESEEKYRTVFENTGSATVVVEEDNIISLANKEFSQLSGFSKDEIEGKKSWTEFVVHEDLERMLAQHRLRRQNNEEALTRYEFRFVTKSGGIRDIYLTIDIIPGTKKSVASLLDITQRKRGEQALSESEEKFRSLAETSPDYIMRYDRQFRHTYMNPAALKVAGLTEGQIIGKTHRESGFDEPQVTFWEEKINLVFETGKPFQAQFSWETVNGLVFLDWMLTPEFAEDKTVRSVLGVSRDITQLKKAEQELYHNLDELIRAEHALRETEARLRGILDATPFPIALTDVSGNTIEFWSRSAFTLFGYTAPTVPGWYQIAYPDPGYREEVMKRWKLCLDNAKVTGQTVNTGEYQVTCRDGSVRICELYATFLPDTLIVTFNDVTERKKAESGFKRRERFLEQLIDTIPSPVFYKDVNGVYLGCNTAFEHFSGLNRHQMMGKTAYDLSPDELACALTANDRELFENPGTRQYETPVMFADGSLHNVIFSKATFTGDQGTVEGLIGIILDITDRKRTEESLSESFATFRTVMDSLDALVYVADMKSFEILFLNQYGRKIWGDLTGKICWDSLQSGQSGPCSFCTNERLLDSNGDPAGILVWEFQNTVNGHWYECHDTAIRWIDGRIVRLEIGIDITERKQAEQALAENEEKFRNIFAAENDALLLVDIETGTIFEANNAACRMFGYSLEELTQLRKTEISAEPEKAEQSIKEQHSWIPLRYQKKKDGTIFPVEISVSRFVLKDRDVLVAAIHDITDRKRAEEALKESERKLADIISFLPDATFVIDINGKVLAWNRAMEEMTGVPAGQMIGKGDYEYALPFYGKRRPITVDLVLHNDPLVAAHYPVMRTKGKSLHSEIFIPHLNKGRGVYLVFKASPLYDGEGNLAGAIESIRDITDLKSAEEALRRTNKKLNLLSSITRHDINNQLTVLQGYLDILGEKQFDPEQNVYFQEAVTAAQRISSMIQFTGQYESIGITAPSWQDCRILVDTAIRQVPLGKVMVKNDLPGGTEVYADQLIVKVFYNLMDNAVRYGGQITTIRFSTKDRGGEEVIICEDDGNGIPAGEKKKIFEREFGRNTGLGLAISREILSITGITITETGETGKGARFELVVPKGSWRVRDSGKN